MEMHAFACVGGEWWIVQTVGATAAPPLFFLVEVLTAVLVHLRCVIALCLARLRALVAPHFCFRFLA